MERHHHIFKMWSSRDKSSRDVIILRLLCHRGVVKYLRISKSWMALSELRRKNKEWGCFEREGRRLFITPKTNAMVTCLVRSIAAFDSIDHFENNFNSK